MNKTLLFVGLFLLLTPVFSQNKTIRLPQAKYPGVLPELTGKNEFISVFVHADSVHVKYKKIYSLLDSVNVFHEFYCRMIKLADSTDENFSISNSYVSVYVDSGTHWKFTDYILEELKHAGIPAIVLKTVNKKQENVGFFMHLVQVPDDRKKYVQQLYGKRLVLPFDRYSCIYANKALIIHDDSPVAPPPPPYVYPTYLQLDLVKKYKESLQNGVDSAYLSVTWKNKKIHINNSPYDVGAVAALIKRLPRTVFFIEMNDKQSYQDFITLTDYLYVSYYLVMEDYCQRKFKKSVRDISSYALREIEKVMPFKYYVVSRAEEAYLNDF